MPAPSHSSGTTMPRAPSSPSSFRAWAGKVWFLSHSAAKGARRSCAKLRMVSRIISCSCVRIMWFFPFDNWSARRRHDQQAAGQHGEAEAFIEQDRGLQHGKDRDQIDEN